MQNTHHYNRKQRILMERLGTYCKQLGVPDVEHPVIFWTKKEVREKYPGERLVKRLLGRCGRDDGWILIVYSMHHNGLRELDETLRHELIHWRFPQIMTHNPRFYKLMKQLKDGVCWETYTNSDYEAYLKKRKEASRRRHDIS